MALTRRSALAVTAILPLAALPKALHAEEWTPNRPTRVIVPFTAGGSTDVLVRSVQEPMQKELGQPMVVDNRPGGSTIIGTLEVVHAPADGNTMLLIANSFAANISLRQSLPYDSLRDFAPITGAAKVTNVLLTHAGFANNFAEFIQAAKKAKDGLSYGSYGIGTTNHLAAEQLFQLAQIKATHVPYSGAAKPIMDLLAGRIDFLIVNMPDALARLNDAQLRMLAVSSKVRAPMLPQVPTLTELGYAEVVADSWFGIMTRSNVPAAARTRLEAAWTASLTLPAVKKDLEARGFSDLAMPSSEFLKEILRYVSVYAEIIKRGNIRVE